MNAPFRPEILIETAPAPLAAHGWPLWPFFVIAALALVEAAWLLATPFSLAPGTAATLPNLAVFALAMILLAHRFRHYERAHAFCMGGAFLFAAWPVLRLFNHLTMSFGFPLADATLAGWDAAIGFDWLSYVRFVDSRPWLLRAVGVCYGNLTGYSCILFMLLAMGREPARRCRELVVLFLVTALFCTSVGAFFPALAAMAYYAPPAELFQHVGPTTGGYHLEALNALRSDPAHIFDLGRMPGLVTFPSFHTAMGIVAIYCARGTPWLFAPMIVINGLMIAATPVFGSHYGIDVIAGAAVAGAAILAYRRLTRVGPNGDHAPENLPQPQFG